jgi:hypothetical protein
MRETLTPTQAKKGRHNNRPTRAGKEGSAGPGDQSLRRAALIAGSALLGLTVLAAYAYVAVIGGLVVDGDATRTASNIAQAEGRFRIGVACFALVALLDVVVAWGLRVLFAPVSEIVSSLAAATRVAYAAVLVVATGHLVTASQLLTGPEGRAGFTTPELQAQGLLQIDAFNAVWEAGLLLFGFHLLLLAYLVIRSSYVPTWLGIPLAAAGCGYLIDSFGLILVRDYSVEVAAFTGVGEAFLMLWLLARGRRIRLRDDSRPAAGRQALANGERR